MSKHSLGTYSMPGTLLHKLQTLTPILLTALRGWSHSRFHFHEGVLCPISQGQDWTCVCPTERLGFQPVGSGTVEYTIKCYSWGTVAPIMNYISPLF